MVRVCIISPKSEATFVEERSLHALKVTILARTFLRDSRLALFAFVFFAEQGEIGRGGGGRERERERERGWGLGLCGSVRSEW